jgi:endonuclease/exonuclease/phosphatase family metal-dependent hydrolase
VTLTLATYNVLDLFGEDEAFVAGKVANLAPIIRLLGADVVGFQEIASDEALARLLDAAGWSGATIVHGTRDSRGIGCSLASRLPVIEKTVLTSPALPFPVFVAGDPSPFGERLPLRRGVVSALIDAAELGRVRVLVAHLKSGRGVPLRTAEGESVEQGTQAELAEADMRSVVWRAAEALFLRRAVDEAFARGDADHVVVLGDMNDVSGSLPLRLLCGCGDAGLSTVVDSIRGPRCFSTLHRGQAEAIDHILVSGSLFDRLAVARFENAGLRDLSVLPPDAPRPLESDHAPLVARFEAALSSSMPGTQP